MMLLPCRDKNHHTQVHKVTGTKTGNRRRIVVMVRAWSDEQSLLTVGVVFKSPSDVSERPSTLRAD